MKTLLVAAAAFITLAAGTASAGNGLPAAFAPGTAFGVMEVPSAGVFMTAYEGSRGMYKGNLERLKELEKGPAHYPGNALPWQKGTVAFSGHRVSHPQTFLNLGNVRLGDPIRLTTPWGVYDYRIIAPPAGHAYAKGWPTTGSPCTGRKACAVVSQKAGWVLKWHKNDGHRLVLLACAPPHDYHYRLVVFAKLVKAKRKGV